MPVFNGLPFVKEAIKSILEQTHKNLELIIINDDSSDGTQKYLMSLKDKRIVIIDNIKNLGVAQSLNIGLEKASGQFIARMDADDISVPTRLEDQINFLTKNNQIDLCGTYAILIDEVGKAVGKLKYPISTEDIKKKLIWANPIIHPSLMAKRHFFKQLNGYRSEYDGAEDYDLLIRGMEKFNYVNLPKELIKLRLSKNRRSIKSMRKMDKLDLKIKIDFIRKAGISPRAISALIRKILTTYAIPQPLKPRLSQLLKKA